MTQAKVIAQKMNRASAELGKAAFEKYNDKSGPEGLTQPIIRGRTRIRNWTLKSSNCWKARPGEFLTPKRLAIGGLALSALLLILVVRGLFFEMGQRSPRSCFFGTCLQRHANRTGFRTRTKTRRATNANKREGNYIGARF